MGAQIIINIVKILMAMPGYTMYKTLDKKWLRQCSPHLQFGADIVRRRRHHQNWYLILPARGEVLAK